MGTTFFFSSVAAHTQNPKKSMARTRLFQKMLSVPTHIQKKIEMLVFALGPYRKQVLRRQWYKTRASSIVKPFKTGHLARLYPRHLYFFGFVRRAPNVTYTIVWWTNRILRSVFRGQNQAETVIFKGSERRQEKSSRAWFRRLAERRKSRNRTRSLLFWIP